MLGIAAAALGAVGTAHAVGDPLSGTKLLQPGDQICRSQTATYQVRGSGSAIGGHGAKFKITRNGVPVPGTGSLGLVYGWAAEGRSSWGTFPGEGFYSVCATNNGTSPTTATVHIFTDGSFS